MNQEVRELEELLQTLVQIIAKETQVRDLYRKACVAPTSEMGRLLCEHLGADEEAHLKKLQAAKRLVQERLAEARRGGPSDPETGAGG
ncbi:MAG: hypothetical protein R6X20_18935 [Phycisphaerae bacterium]